MLFSSLDTLLRVSKTTSPKKLFANDCVYAFGSELDKLYQKPTHTLTLISSASYIEPHFTKTYILGTR